jgi:hypothetical protein
VPLDDNEVNEVRNLRKKVEYLKEQLKDDEGNENEEDQHS